MDCTKVKLEIKEEKYDADGESSYSGYTDFPVSHGIKCEHEQKPMISSELVVAKEDPEHLESVTYDSNPPGCSKESSVLKNETGQDSSPEDNMGTNKVECELENDESILKVESNDPNISKEEVRDFIEGTFSKNVAVFPDEAANDEVPMTADSNVLEKKRFELFCDVTVEGVYKCVLCEHSTLFISSFKKHISAEHRDAFKFRCDKCDKLFISKTKLNQHTYIHRINSMQCSHCDHTSKSVREHHKHYNTKHGRKIKCKHCNYVTSVKLRLQAHIKHNHDASILFPHICMICKKDFPIASQLEKHQSRHSGARPFKCRFCDYRCSISSGIREHEKALHIERKHYKCSSCQKRLSTEKELNEHMQISHPEFRPFSCRFCYFRCSRKRGIYRHEKGQHIEEMCYKCSSCQDSFSTEKELNEHKRPYSSIPGKCKTQINLSRTRNKVKAKASPPQDELQTVMKCDACNEHFPSKKVLSKHQRYCVFC